LEKLELQLDLSEKTKDYAIGTSLRNYIDPRVFKAWTEEVGAEWEKLYTAALQKKFLWVKNEDVEWKDLK
jgi:DNA topoisomerase-1